MPLPGKNNHAWDNVRSGTYKNKVCSSVRNKLNIAQVGLNFSLKNKVLLSSVLKCEWVTYAVYVARESANQLLGYMVTYLKPWWEKL